MRTAVQLGVLWVVPALAAADTLVVDANNGPGTDFTNLQQAIQAAQSGDVLVVKQGTYAAITIDGKRLSVVGEPGVSVVGASSVRNLNGQRVELSSLGFGALTIEDCTAPVFGDHLTAIGGAPTALRVVDSADVRLRDSVFGGSPFFFGDGGDGAVVTGSRVELSDCELYGSSGEPGFFDDGGDGGDALRAEAGSFVHLAGSSLTGGYGGDGECTPFFSGGNGGSGLVIDPGAEVVLVGRSDDTITRGEGGEDCGGGFGLPGATIANGGTLRWSGVTVVGGYPNETVPADPWLEVLGTPANGSFDTVLRVHGNPGDFVRLFLGRIPVVFPPDGPAIELLLVKLRTVNLGFVPAAGHVDYPFPQLGLFDVGVPLVAQATTTSTEGVLQRTNSTPLVVRQP